MIILGTIPVGIVGVVLQKEFTKVFAKPELAAIFLAINGVILLVSERMRRAREARGGRRGQTWRRRRAEAGLRRARRAGRATGPAGGPAQGYQQQPRQQQWQGPDPRYGQDDWQQPAREGRRQQAVRGDGRGGRGQGSTGRGGQYGRKRAGSTGGPVRAGRSSTGRISTGGTGRAAATAAAPPQQPSGGRGTSGSPSTGRAVGRPAGAGRGCPGPPSKAATRAARGAAGTSATSVRPRGAAAAAGRAARGRGRAPRAAAGDAGADPAVAADRRLSTITLWRAVTIGAAQILALLPGISRDGIVTVAGMGRGLRREDAVRFSFLLSAPVILAAGALKMSDLTGPISKGMHGPIIVGSLIAGIGAYVSIRFLTKYFSEDKSLNPFGYLLHHRRAREPRVPGAQVTLVTAKPRSYDESQQRPPRRQASHRGR